jgi:diguanylate cyclase (GGDEF)-like protein/putative nucleotidyltransferase with HDIG domain
MVVYGACLVLVGITATAQAAVITADFQTTTLGSIVENDAALVRTVVNTFVQPDDLGADGLATDRLALLTQTLAAMNSRAGIVRSELRTVDGRVVASDVVVPPGAKATVDSSMAKALTGQATASLVDSHSAGSAGPALAMPDLIREDLPLMTADGTVEGDVVLWRDAGPILAAVDQARREVVLLTLTAALVLAGILYFVFKAAQQRITRQARALVDATRRDVLTGLLNHGALVEHLAAEIELARSGGNGVAVALVDIDNFRLLNDTLGHATGDVALVRVAALLAGRLPPGGLVGRYGPDEFLVVSSGTSAAMRLVVDAARTDLASEVIGDTDGDRLPMTVSAGLCQYPADADSAIALLALAGSTLGEAKVSGGDAVQVAHPELASEEPRGFDVLRGLVIAIDTKDRYTKRHSEDVARYALFLASQLGLDAELHRIIRLGGLLHDVGKIGIPDYILRKPGVLTADESDAVKQHVALGDLMVGALPELEAIRAGVRHHHERWDGRGYLHGLAGEEIPLVARILAVGDVFSAMTTTRPYRKAIDIEEAIRRLEDAAGTQLDERLVTTFVTGLRTAADAPLPGNPGPALWTPARAA